MTYEDWVEQYKPIKNPTADHGYDQTMFETYEPDIEMVRKAEKADARTIWTIVEGDNSGLYITDGYHYVNRVGYFITEVPFEGESLEVCIGDPDRYYADQHTGFDWTVVDRESGKPFCVIPMGFENAEDIASEIADALNANGIELDLSHEDDEDDDSRCLTEGCTEDANNGEGFDGYCGTCADRREPKTCERCGDPAVTELDGDDLCQVHADAWVKAERATVGED